ncbi:PilZ domain-containing protein [Sphingomonas sp.]
MDEHAYSSRPHESDDAASQRNASRDSLFLTATLKLDDDETTVRVRNLSPGGLMAEYGKFAAIDTDVRVNVRGIGWISGKVAWAVDGRLGIAFDKEVDPMLARKPVGQGTQTPVYVKPPLSRR